MIDPKRDYLWNPNAHADPEIMALEAQLQSFGSKALRLADRRVPSNARRLRPSRWWIGIAASLAVTVAGSAVLLRHRLEWPASAAWTLSRTSADGQTRVAQLDVGSVLATQANETITLAAARIGTITLAPGSAINLLETRTGRHRLELQHGRLHAKIWAPPGHFGVRSGDGVAVDLGCEFEIMTETTGRGALKVANGWVMYVRGANETLVPENYELTFDTDVIATPVRLNADRSFRDLATQLDSQFIQGAPDTARVDALAASIAAAATQADAFTLLSFLTRHPQLASTPLYERLASAFGISLDEAHRSRWLRNDTEAKNEWWSRLPKQPKRWWLHWSDAL
jgi:hypothetical protein